MNPMDELDNLVNKAKADSRAANEIAAERQRALDARKRDFSSRIEQSFTNTLEQLTERGFGFRATPNGLDYSVEVTSFPGVLPAGRGFQGSMSWSLEEDGKVRFAQVLPTRKDHRGYPVLDHSTYDMEEVVPTLVRDRMAQFAVDFLKVVASWG